MTHPTSQLSVADAMRRITDSEMTQMCLAANMQLGTAAANKLLDLFGAARREIAKDRDQMTQPKRIQLRRTNGWRKPAGAVVVSRGPGSRPFANPFTVAAAAEAGYANPQRAAVTAFRDWLAGDPWACPSHNDYATQRAELLRRLPELRGRDLCCWCALDQPCHADVLLEIANK